MLAVLAIVLRRIARNLGGDYGCCVHCNHEGKWVLRPNSSDRATAWKLGGLEHSSWLVLDHSDDSLRIGGALQPSWADEWDELQRLGQALPAEGVTAAYERDIRKQLLKLLVTSGNHRLRWTKAEVEMEMDEVLIEGTLGSLPPKLLPVLRAERKRPALDPAPPKRRVILED